MSELLERRVVQCPYNIAKQYLEEEVAPHVASGEASRLVLTLSTPSLDIAKAVSVTFRRAEDPMHFERPWHIHWDPPNSAYPTFDGELTVRADETYSTSRLELKGSYQPPGGPLGAAFDWVAGGRIAKSTAQSLLAQIGNGMEAHYQRDEDAKKRSREA
jgi:hypothetical protein